MWQSAPGVLSRARRGDITRRKQSLDRQSVAGAFKACHDKVAELLGVDDADDRVIRRRKQVIATGLQFDGYSADHLRYKLKIASLSRETVWQRCEISR